MEWEFTMKCGQGNEETLFVLTFAKAYYAGHGLHSIWVCCSSHGGLLSLCLLMWMLHNLNLILAVVWQNYRCQITISLV